MNFDKHDTASKVGRKQLIAIVALIVLGVVAAVAILRSGDDHGEHGGHGHEEARGHADGEHHDEKAGDGHDHDHDKGHGDGEHHEEARPKKDDHGAEAKPAGEAGRIAMTDAQVKAAGIAVETATAAAIRSTLQLPGEIRFNEDRTAHVVPRVGGVVEAVSANLGQQVRKGQVLAVVSSATVSEQRSSLRAAQQRLVLARTTYEREKTLWEEKISPQQDLLQAQQALREAEIAVANEQQKLGGIGAGAGAGPLGRYELRAPFDGMVVEKHIALGEMVKEDTQVFTISDLSSVWAELSIGAKDLDQVRVGAKVQVRSAASEARANGTVSYVGSLIGEQTRTAKARVTLTNPELTWRPGLFVNVDIVGSEAAVPVTVSSEAVQMVNEQPVVFVKVPGGFLPQPVRTGRSDATRVEIVSGLREGAAHAAAGSFIVKSEQGKASASHEH